MSEADWWFVGFALLSVVSAALSRQWKPLVWVAAIGASYLNSDLAWRSSLGPVEAATLTLIGRLFSVAAVVGALDLAALPVRRGGERDLYRRPSDDRRGTLA